MCMEEKKKPNKDLEINKNSNRKTEKGYVWYESTLNLLFTSILRFSFAQIPT